MNNIRARARKGKNMKQTAYDIARMIDISCVRSYMNQNDIEQMAKAAAQHHFICAHVLPSNVPYLKELLVDANDVLIGCPAGFPSGGSETKTKVCEMKNCVGLGCDEIDAVANIGWLCSNRFQDAKDDIKAVIEAAQGKPIKVILEVMQLDEYQIQKGAEMAVSAGAEFVKTGTGWMQGPTTRRHIELINDAVGGQIQIKASGGIRGLDTILEMNQLGVQRFGVGFQAAVDIINEAAKREGANK